MPPEHRDEVYRRTYEWFGIHRDAMTESGAELQPVTSATTVRRVGDAPVVADGPFSEAKEVVGGFQEIERRRPRRAIALVKTWPMLELPGGGRDPPIVVY